MFTRRIALHKIRTGFQGSDKGAVTRMSDVAVRMATGYPALLRADPEIAGNASEPASTPNIDACFKILAATQEQVRLADGKTSFLFGINALMFGFVASAVGPLKAYWHADQQDPIALFATLSLIGFIILDATAVVTLICMIVSRFGGTGTTSHLFFGHIVHRFGRDHERYANEVFQMNEQDWGREVCAQIVEVSHIALTKHRLVRRAAWFTIAAFGCWLLAVLATALLG